MPSGDVAPGWVLPTCGLGHHHVAARPSGGRQVGRGGADEGIDVVEDGPDCRAAVGPRGYGEMNSSASPLPARRRADLRVGGGAGHRRRIRLLPGPGLRLGSRLGVGVGLLLAVRPTGGVGYLVQVVGGLLLPAGTRSARGLLLDVLLLRAAGLRARWLLDDVLLRLLCCAAWCCAARCRAVDDGLLVRVRRVQLCRVRTTLPVLELSTRSGTVLRSGCALASRGSS